jgi:hypothetical protein
MDELSSTFEKMTLAKAGSLSLPPVEVPVTPKRTFAEFDAIETQLPRAKRLWHDTMTMISAPCPPTLSKVAAMLTPKRSILERLPNEILSSIYLISHNTSLLLTCRTIQNALATDVLFKQLALAAFDRSDLCERHQERAEHHKNCTFSQQGVNTRNTSSNTVVPNTAQDSEYDEYGQFKVCGLEKLYACYDRAKNCNSHSSDTRRVECVMPIREKRNLQKQILQSRYFRLHHLTAVEDACAQNKECEREFSRAYKSMVSFIQLDPVPEFDFAALWAKHHHRHHILHGVRYPKALLEGPLNAEGVKMLEKLFDWTSDGIWFRLGCERDRSTVIKSGGIGMNRAIAAGHIETLKLLARLAIYGTPATPTTPQGYGISIAWIRDALAIDASTAAIRTLLQVLNFHSINQNVESQDAYKTALDRAKKNKEDGKWEAWIYNSLVAKKLLGGGTSGMNGVSSSKSRYA